MAVTSEAAKTPQAEFRFVFTNATGWISRAVCIAAARVGNFLPIAFKIFFRELQIILRDGRDDARIGRAMRVHRLEPLQGEGAS